MTARGEPPPDPARNGPERGPFGPETFALRPASHSDLDALAALERQTLASPWSRRQLADDLDRGVPRPPEANRPDRPAPPSPQSGAASRLLVAEAPDGSLAGYLAARRIVDQAELLRVAVAPCYRRRGLATRLIERALAELAAAGAATCFLEVREDDAGARAFYASCGFEPAGRRPGYYPDGATALILRRRLARSTPPAD